MKILKIFNDDQIGIEVLKKKLREEELKLNNQKALNETLKIDKLRLIKINTALLNSFSKKILCLM